MCRDVDTTTRTSFTRDGVVRECGFERTFSTTVTLVDTTHTFSTTVERPPVIQMWPEDVDGSIPVWLYRGSYDSEGDAIRIRVAVDTPSLSVDHTVLYSEVTPRTPPVSPPYVPGPLRDDASPQVKALLRNNTPPAGCAAWADYFYGRCTGDDWVDEDGGYSNNPLNIHGVNPSTGEPLAVREPVDVSRYAPAVLQEARDSGRLSTDETTYLRPLGHLGPFPDSDACFAGGAANSCSQRLKDDGTPTGEWYGWID